ncbi:lysophospholipid acyltransferase family protein [Pacificoceanicola onchidii]|uniref:lysophospholipid acyltransferase family protein n=1 Tax=Pacificoceanicola onchidii TaxID=2562685 RepID=UPI0010A5B5EF|nr:lysophospholipid acyltransferase family protein [Pacificoceanicola onchidii]
MSTWEGPPMPPAPKLGVLGWLLVLLRGIPMAFVVFGGLLLLLLVRLIERPLFGMDRPVTPWITLAVCRTALAIMGLKVRTNGRFMRERGAIVANHASWLDIFVLNSRKTLYFVSKAEVAAWPGIGWLARATGTVFIKRDRREARKQTEVFEERLMHGHKLLFFPEGTSTDGQRVLSFKTTLFAAFFSERLEHEMHMQALSVRYHAPEGQHEAFYGWWGDMDFGGSLIKMLGARRHGTVTLTYHPPVRVDTFPNRKSLAAHLETDVRRGFEQDG